MSYLVLARKYRPTSFDDVLGQEAVTRTLANALRMGRVAHAYLFAGPRGVGKTSVARILARSLNCVEGPTPEPCGQCERCRMIAAGHDIDVREIDAASNRGIDHIRELRDSVRYAPASGKHKVYIIDEVHQLTTESFNALLKTLEEPPQHVNFIFATTELDKVPETVRSRCQIFEFRSLSIEQIAEHLESLAAQERFELDAQVAHAVARRARGSLRDAQSLLDQLVTLDGGRPSLAGLQMITGSVGQDLLLRALQAATEEREGDLLEIAGEVSAKGASVADLFDQMLELMRELMVARASHGPRVKAASGEPLAELAGRLDLDRILAMMQVVIKGRSRLRDLDEHRLVLEMTLLKLARIAGSLDLPAALSYLRRLRLPAAPGAPRPRQGGGGDAPAAGRPQRRAESAPVSGRRRAGKASRSTAAPGGAPGHDPSCVEGGSAATPVDPRAPETSRPEPPRPADEPAAPKAAPPRGMCGGTGPGADLTQVFEAFLEALGRSSKRLMASVREHYEPVRVSGSTLVLRALSGATSSLYDLRHPKERSLVQAALAEVLPDGACLEVTDDTNPAAPPDPSRPDGSRGRSAGTSGEGVARAQELFGGEVVEG